MRDAVRLIDPARGVELLHFLRVEFFHVGSWVRLQTGGRIFRQRRMQTPITHRTRKNPENNGCEKDHPQQHGSRADPGERKADIARLVLRGAKMLLRHGASPPQACQANVVHVKPARLQSQSRQAWQIRQPSRGRGRMQAIRATSHE
jgi:hypothetical protein